MGNLSPKYTSSLSGIHLVSIAKSSIIQEYGMDKIIEPFMADINELEKVIRLKRIEHTIYPLVLIITFFNYMLHTGGRCRISTRHNFTNI